MKPLPFKAIAAYLDKVANELETTYFHPKYQRPSPLQIHREVQRVRRWARALRRTSTSNCCETESHK